MPCVLDVDGYSVCSSPSLSTTISLVAMYCYKQLSAVCIHCIYFIKEWL